MRVSIRTDDMAHFARGLSSPGGPTLPAKSATFAGLICAPRTVFGDCMADTLAPFITDNLMGVPEVTGWAERIARHAFVAQQGLLPHPIDRR